MLKSHILKINISAECQTTTHFFLPTVRLPKLGPTSKKHYRTLKKYIGGHDLLIFSLKPAQGEALKDGEERIVQCGIALTYCWGERGRGGGRVI
jgi:hypothetical protein